MEAKNTTFNRPSHEEVRQMLLRAKARQQQLEEEGKRMWEESNRFYFETDYSLKYFVDFTKEDNPKS
jgi:hypothetical protein